VLENVPFDRDVGAAEIGTALDLLIWDVAKALRRLALKGMLREGAGKARGTYRRSR
jgi:predicted nucleic acid-binding protein